MKIKVKDLLPNPFRDFGCYAIDEERIEGLSDSMKKDEFWGGIPIRPHPTKKGKYQIGCGHHRLLSLKQNRTEEIDITAIYPYSDAQMLRIMINENAQYAARPKLVNSDVEKAKIFLDAEFAKCDWGTSEKYFRGLFDNKKAFDTTKGMGVGRETILKYLGPSWKKREWMVQAAIATLKAEKEGSINREALETIPTMDQANIFRASVKKHEVPKPIQKTIAKKIVEESICSKEIPKEVAKHSRVLAKPQPKTDLKELEELITSIGSIANALEKKIKLLRSKMKKLNVKQIKGIKTQLSGMALGRLFKELKRFDKDEK